ncbi:hypothetical protein SAY86_022433 [Trapa natans]|uniref:BHLH domain-containing protein n=1 Tax=Trapa natans TaxID=22666 RepID=A0AAN7LND9_TRANT|nr:hypothetical protein SAY86_022433 [Trapa natans]
MNRGVLQLQSPPVMAGGNPKLPWSMNGTHPLSTAQSPPPFMAPASSYIFSGHPYHAFVSSLPSQQAWQDNPESFSQLIAMGGLAGKEGDQNWQEQVLIRTSPTSHSPTHVKQEDSAGSGYVYCHPSTGNHFQATATKPSGCTPGVSASSPNSCITSMSPGVLNFLSKRTEYGNHTSSECVHGWPGAMPSSSTTQQDRWASGNNNVTAGAPKKAKAQPSSSLSIVKKQVRKEKLGDRISALHQLVSPFGKTDTASVLQEAIRYITFLQNQIEALSLPYLGNNASASIRQPHTVLGDTDYFFPENPGQILNNNYMKRKLGAPDETSQEEQPRMRDLSSRGLCLVPVSFTLQLGNDNGADYWASAFSGGFR